MATPTIDKQPSSTATSNAVRSTLLPISFELTGPAGTLYIVATVKYWDRDNSAWRDLAGGLRLQQTLDNPLEFRFNAQDVLNTITFWDYLDLRETVNDYQEYRIGGCGHNFENSDITLNGDNFHKCKVVFQREFLNADGLIELDTDEEESNHFYVIEAGFKQQDLFSMRESSEFDAFNIVHDGTSVAQSFRLLTNAPQPFMSTRSGSSNFISFMLSKEDTSGGTMTQVCVVLCYTYSGGSFVGVHAWRINSTFGTPFAYYDVGQFIQATGIRDLECALQNSDPNLFSDTIFPAESIDGSGTDLSAVDTMWCSLLMQTTGNSMKSMASWTVENIQAPNYITNTTIGCETFTDSSNFVNLNFHFKNQLGGMDRWVCYGHYTVSKKVQYNQFQKTDSFNVFDKKSGEYGVKTIGNESVDVYKVETYQMTPATAEWLMEMFMSPMVLLELPVSRNVGSQYLWSNSMVVPVIFDKTSIKFKDTEESQVTLEFTCTVAKKTKNPTN